MEHNDQLHVEAEEALANINKKTGRNMPQAVATGAVLVIIILASLLIRIDVFVLLIVVFMVLALWELRVDFARSVCISRSSRCGCVRRPSCSAPITARTISARWRC